MYENFVPIMLMDTGEMNHDQFSKAREQIALYTGGVSIGGSDISTIFGLNPWTSPQELFDRKSGVFPEIDVEKNAWQKNAGHILEEAVVQMGVAWLQEHHPDWRVSVENDTYMYQCGNPKYPFAVANLDRVITINGQTGVFEAKTTSFRNKKALTDWQNGVVPAYYELQVRYYMEVMNYDFAVVACMWGTTMADMSVILVRRDKDKGRLMMETVKDFVDHIHSKAAPDFSKCDPMLVADYYTRLYGEMDEDLPDVDLSGHEQEVEQALKLDEEIDELEKQLEAAKSQRQDLCNIWRPIFGKSERGNCVLPDGRKAMVTLKPSYRRQSLDEELLATEKPDVYQKYLTAFDAKKFKMDNLALYKQYQTKKEINPDKPATCSIRVRM